MMDVAETVAVADAINHPGIGVHLDSGIMTLNGEDPHAAVALAAPRLVHFHVSEPNLDPVDGGRVDHIAMASALRSVDYHGYVSIEMRPPIDQPSLETVLRAVDLVLNTYV